MSYLLKGTVIPGTRLRAKADVTAMELLRLVGPEIGKVYQELSLADPDTLSSRDQARLAWMREWFELVDASEKVYVGRSF